MKIFSGKNDSWRLCALFWIDLHYISSERSTMCSKSLPIEMHRTSPKEGRRLLQGHTVLWVSCWALNLTLTGNLAPSFLLHAVSSLDAVTKHTPQEKEGQVAESWEETIWLDVFGCVDGNCPSDTRSSQTALQWTFLLGNYRRKVTG